jgi:hypothetical protein
LPAGSIKPKPKWSDRLPEALIVNLPMAEIITEEILKGLG